MSYLRYSPEIESPAADEQKTIDGIVSGMKEQSRTVERRDGEAVRASHAKSTACVTGELRIADGLPEELAQGLFATARTLPVAVRFAQGPGEKLNDRVSVHRGMSIKVFGVGGEKMEGHTSDVQDFVLATGTTFPSGTAKGFLRDGTVIGKATGLPEEAKSAVASFARNLNRVLERAGTVSPMADFFGHPFYHPLAESYFSQAPMRFGDYVAKLAAVPVSPEQAALRDWRLDARADDNGFRHAAIAFFGEHDAVFEIRAQLWTDAKTQPIEDASVEWSSDETPFRTVATLVLPKQAAYGDERVRYFDKRMTFRPAHSLEAHRPLGSIMRARLQVYAALSDFRHSENGIEAADPSRIEDIPR
ncbi:catalase family protein [Pararhizobium mangrovi]|uniref:Catalase family protein n=1 Tax=Pararhizobium mangrovi TaxID=2590452 RepID=A0A506U0C7_9HYPH|nr:catalase family protein [Pararhizobium mangrovi]TPW27016.1 catalase family protein [Pararhizobium mangrovi]